MALKTMYRGVRMTKHQLEICKNDGMTYYWETAEQVVSDIFRALQDNHKLKKLGNEPHLREFILEGTRQGRIQMFATDDKKNANSYARWTPELIFLALDWVGIPRKDLQKYLNKRYGTPYIVTFEMNVEHPEILLNNERIGHSVPADWIKDIEEVDLNSKDPLYESWSSIVQ